ncbi:hypothetical protein ACIF6L_26510 [Kitasatospora sp. NPDC086009]|uniref:hypothetical protein n=1 Tax=unclassified Kitasatospora TaxID=2633591 RepID=UPI0037CC07B9
MTESASVSEGLLEVREHLVPFFDAADGMRRDMEARGWSSAMAEYVAGRWLANLLTGGKG